MGAEEMTRLYYQIQKINRTTFLLTETLTDSSISETKRLLARLKGEGDAVNEEISYVVNWAYLSNTKTFYNMTFKNKKWEEIYSFPI